MKHAVTLFPSAQKGNKPVSAAVPPSPRQRLDTGMSRAEPPPPPLSLLDADGDPTTSEQEAPQKRHLSQMRCPAFKGHQ